MKSVTIDVVVCYRFVTLLWCVEPADPMQKCCTQLRRQSVRLKLDSRKCRVDIN